MWHYNINNNNRDIFIWTHNNIRNISMRWERQNIEIQTRNTQIKKEKYTKNQKQSQTSVS